MSNICLKQGQGMRGRAAPPHPGIYRVPPGDILLRGFATRDTLSFEELKNLLYNFAIVLFTNMDWSFQNNICTAHVTCLDLWLSS